mmetsp:Transcript_70598/g.132110  ORF Transcript_70598/g.132110 Transcript_70598/m.132110 type:complete len:238 (+) Transcript_70598:78-791(+)
MERIKTWVAKLLVQQMKGSLAEKERLRPDEPEYILGHLQFLCTLYESCEEFESARDTSLRIVSIQTSLGSPPKERLRQLVRLGGFHVQFGDHDSAIESLTQAMGIVKENDELQAELLEILNLLGQALVAKGAGAEAEEFLCEALALTKEKHGHNSIQLAQSLHLLGKVYTSQGRFKAARESLLGSIRIMEDFHPRRQSEILEARKDYSKAQELSGELVEVLGGDDELANLYIVYKDA